MSSDCLFCRIVAGELPTDKVYEDEFVFAFRDINPQAPVHILVIPKQHVPALAEYRDEHVELAGRLQLAIRDIAVKEGLNDGFRVVVNNGERAGQTVFHLHYHLLGGRDLGWPPG